MVPLGRALLLRVDGDLVHGQVAVAGGVLRLEGIGEGVGVDLAERLGVEEADVAPSVEDGATDTGALGADGDRRRGRRSTGQAVDVVVGGAEQRVADVAADLHVVQERVAASGVASSWRTSKSLRSRSLIRTGLRGSLMSRMSRSAVSAVSALSTMAA